MRIRIGILAAVALLLAPRAASAFCGFYVSGASGPLYNDATQVVLMRAGTRTVLSMQNNYKGPPEAFAMVIPVPVVLHEQDVKTLAKDVFAKVDVMGAPRLVEYWEQDPCAPMLREEEGKMGGKGRADNRQYGEAPAGHGVTIEARFTVGEYQILILSATDSAGLDTWLREEKYTIPPGAEPLLRPYVEAGSKFFVAKVDPKKVKFEDGRAALSPLRFHYDVDEFSLPIRLGLVSSSGTQDLIVSILAPQQRYELANYPNVTIPTNLDVKDAVRDRFGEFYAALFDRTLEKHPGAVVTEYAWDASTCDPCPGPQLDGSDFQTLGADVLAVGQEEQYQGGFVLTRLHARYGKDGAPSDLVFKKADAIVGGREMWNGGKLEERASPSSYNNFQGRYAIRHEWTGPIACQAPRRGVWGGPPSGEPSVAIKPALDLAFAPRGQARLPELVAADVPELEVKAAGAAAKPSPPPPVAVDASSDPWAGTGGPPADKPKQQGGCGCNAGADGSLLIGLAVALQLRRHRRRRGNP